MWADGGGGSRCGRVGRVVGESEEIGLVVDWGSS